MASYRTGPLAGIEYATERQKRNAREYQLAEGRVLLPGEVQHFARGLYGQARRATAKNKTYFRNRWAQQKVANEGGDLESAVSASRDPNSAFEKAWRKAGAAGFSESPAFSELLKGAGMRTGLPGDWDDRPRIHYQQYIRIMWDDLEDVGSNKYGDELNDLYEEDDDAA